MLRVFFNERGRPSIFCCQFCSLSKIKLIEKLALNNYIAPKSTLWQSVLHVFHLVHHKTVSSRTVDIFIPDWSNGDFSSLFTRSKDSKYCCLYIVWIDATSSGWFVRLKQGGVSFFLMSGFFKWTPYLLPNFWTELTNLSNSWFVLLSCITFCNMLTASKLPLTVADLDCNVRATFSPGNVSNFSDWAAGPRIVAQEVWKSPLWSCQQQTVLAVVVTSLQAIPLAIADVLTVQPVGQIAAIEQITGLVPKIYSHGEATA